LEPTDNAIDGMFSDSQINDRYQEICSVLAIAPPKFEIKPVAEMQGRDGLYVRHQDGGYSIFIAGSIRSPEAVDFVLIHELAHHALHLAGYSSPGHAWVMLSVEQILFKKAGVGIDSIYRDAQNNWPKHIFWGVWLRHVQHAYEISGCCDIEAHVMHMDARDIARWVLEHPPWFEEKLWNNAIGRQLLGMKHTLISDHRSAHFFTVWLSRALLVSLIALFAVGDTLNLSWLKNLSSGVLLTFFIVASLAIGLFKLFAQARSATKAAVGAALKIKSFVGTKK